jgi:prophage regulatory protein
MDELLRWPAVKKLCGISRPTAWRMEMLGAFPRRRQISRNAVGWLRSEVDAWVRAREPVAAPRKLDNLGGGHA